MEKEEDLRENTKKAAMILKLLTDSGTKHDKILLILLLTILIFVLLNKWDLKKVSKISATFLDPIKSHGIVELYKSIINNEVERMESKKTNDITKSKIHLVRPT